MKRLTGYFVSLALVCAMCLSCTSGSSNINKSIYLDIPESDMIILNNLKEDISDLNLDYKPKQFQKEDRLEERWSIDSDVVYMDYITAIEPGWVLSTYDDIENHKNDSSYDVSYVVNPYDGEKNPNELTKYYGILCSSSGNDCWNSTRKYIETINKTYCVVQLRLPYLVNKDTGDVESVFSNAEVYDRQIISTQASVYCYSPPWLYRINLDNPSKIYLMPGFYDNVYEIECNLWLQFGTLRLFDEQTNCVKDSVYIEDYIELDIPNNLENIPTVQYLRNGKYRDFIVGQVVNYDQLVEVTHGFNTPNYWHFLSPLEDYYPPERNIDIIKYILFNPNSPDANYTIDEKNLGTMDAVIRIKNNHFIVENDSVLKCIDPFEGNDIWWIDREDVGQEAKILWADERGVLVYSYTHQKLYCFE